MIVPNSEPKLLPATPTRSGSISGRAASQSMTTRAASAQAGTLTWTPRIGALVLARAVEREHGDAAAEPAVAVAGDTDLLEAVHAWQ